jgi:hypothetical protein
MEQCNERATLIDRMLTTVEQQHDALNQEPSRMRSVWEELRARLAGKFILAHDLAATQMLLASTAHYYGLEVPALIGASFTGLCQEYLAPGCSISGAMPDDESISGSPLLDAPDAGQGEHTALGHARTMLRLLKRMAQGA